jgi:hypothetical protein
VQLASRGHTNKQMATGRKQLLGNQDRE